MLQNKAHHNTDTADKAMLHMLTHYEGHPEYSQYQSMENNGLAQERANNQWPRLNNGDGQFHTGQYNTNTPTWLPQNQNNRC